MPRTTKKTITIKGTVTEFEWNISHVQTYLDVKDEKGGIVDWSVETYSLGKLVRAVLTKEVVKSIDRVSTHLSPARNGTPVGFSHKMMLPNSKEFGL